MRVHTARARQTRVRLHDAIRLMRRHVRAVTIFYETAAGAGGAAAATAAVVVLIASLSHT